MSLQEREVRLPDPLQRAVVCNACIWLGIAGDCVGGDTFRCDRCGSEDISILCNPAPKALQ
jgi:hypothetical protein